MKVKFLALVATILLTWSAVLAQDPLFTQFYASPSFVNPALSASSQGSFRVFGQYRNQWASVLDDAITTFATGGDVHFDLPYDRSNVPDRLSVSLIFLSDRLGAYDFGSTSISMGSAFHKSLHKNQIRYLSAGIQLGIHQKSFIYEEIFFEDQFNGIDAFSGSTDESRPANSFAHSDINVGVNFSAQYEAIRLVQVGVSLQHVLSPNVSFYKDHDDPGGLILKENELLSKINVNGSFEYDVNDFFRIIPRAIYSKQRIYSYIQAGSNFRIAYGEVSGRAVQFGGAIRMIDGLEGLGFSDLILMAGLEFSGLNIGFSYDLNVASFEKTGNRPGTFEFTIAFIGAYESEDNICPTF